MSRWKDITIQNIEGKDWKYQADQLQQTINRLSNFELKIDFSCSKEVTSKL